MAYQNLESVKHKIPAQFRYFAVSSAGGGWCYINRPSWNSDIQEWVPTTEGEPRLYLGLGFAHTAEPIIITPTEDLNDVIDDLHKILWGLHDDWTYIAVDADGVYCAYQEPPIYTNGVWENSKDVLHLGRMFDQQGVDFWKTHIIDRNGLIPAAFIVNGDKLKALFAELTEHMKHATGKHPEFPNNKGFGLAAVTEEYLELAMAINDKEETERIVSEAKDTIITLMRLIFSLREEAKCTQK